MRPDAAAASKTHTYLLAEPSLPDIFSGQAKLLYIKNDNPSFGQRLKNFIFKPLKIVTAKASLLNVLRDSAFKDNEEAKNLTNHIKSLGFFEGVSTFRVKDFLVDAALHGSRLASALDTNNNAKKSLAELTDTALSEHLNNPGYMYETLQEYVGKTAQGLNEFHIFQADPTVVLSDKQIANIYALNNRIAVLKSNPEKSKSIPAEVFIKFSEIYKDFSERNKVKDLTFTTSNLVDRLSALKDPPTSLVFFLSFFDPKLIKFEDSAHLPLAKHFVENIEKLKSDLDVYGIDKTMRATLNILAEEFMVHIKNPKQSWKTAEEVIKLNLELKEIKNDEEKYWI